MDIRKIRKLIELIDETGVAEIEIREGEESVRICRGYAPAPVQTQMACPPPSVVHATENSQASAVVNSKSAAEVSGHIVRSPMVGTVYFSSSPESEPFAPIGKALKLGETICIIEAMKMFNEIETDKAGKVKKILVDNGQPVEYGQALFVIE